VSASADLLRVTNRPPTEAAPRLLGAILTHAGVAVRLTEVEAYAGADDPGSHAFRGPTPRTTVMFGPPAHLYVYFTYGMHHCANVVCEPTGTAGAVLLRAGEVVEGVVLARERRGAGVRTIPDRDLARGPGRLCQALGIGVAQAGADLVSGAVRLVPPRRAAPASKVATGPRVGLRAAPDRPWRYWLTGEPTVSPYRAATRRSPQVDSPPTTR
jgi:DNA-3-methyladenine glycosylase